MTTGYLCPHCGRWFGHAKHGSRCAMEPTRHALLHSVLDDGAGRIIRANDYEVIAAACGLPSSKALRETFGQSWRDCAEHFGLTWQWRVAEREPSVDKQQLTARGESILLERVDAELNAGRVRALAGAAADAAALQQAQIEAQCMAVSSCRTDRCGRVWFMLR